MKKLSEIKTEEEAREFLLRKIEMGHSLVVVETLVAAIGLADDIEDIIKTLQQE